MSQGDTPNEPFLGGQDRPPVQLNPDTPLSELRVRDLAQILGTQASAKKVEKIEFAKEIKSELKIEKLEKVEHKEKPEKWEHKEKPEKFEHKEKPEKWEHKEKPEKWEHKEKPEKIEHKEKPEKFEHKDKVEQIDKLRLEPVPKTFDPGPGPGPLGPGGDPRIDQLIQVVSQLQADVRQMRQQSGGGGG